ncbi:MAG TPA: VOC family protein [Acidimicrobiales bacterium]|nr:VOC family protein [Acidimicrobiales bacterium]
MRVSGLDHIVLRVADVERSLAWYGGTLGLEPVRVEEWRGGDAPFPSVRVDDSTIIDLLVGGPDGNNMDHFCLVVEPCDLGQLAASGRFEVLDGPGPRFGARGMGTSLYVRDPDGNTVELRHYG